MEPESPDNNIQDSAEYLILSSDESVICENEIRNVIPKTKSSKPKRKSKERSGRKSRQSTPSLSSSDGKFFSDDNAHSKNRNKKSDKPKKTGKGEGAADFATGSFSRGKRKYNTSDPLTSERTLSGRKIRKVDDNLPPGPRSRPARSSSPPTFLSESLTSDCASLSLRIENHLEQSSSKSRQSLTQALLESKFFLTSKWLLTFHSFYHFLF